MFNQRCSSCQSEWNAIKRVDTCPFCGNAFNVKKNNFETPEDVFEYIISENGAEIVKQNRVFLSLFMDLAPFLIKERRAVKGAIDAGVYVELLSVSKTDEGAQKIAFAKAVNKLTDELLVDHTWAHKTVVWFVEQLGWSSVFWAKNEEHSSSNTPYAVDLFSVGQDVAFGRYKYQDNTTVNSIKWKILDIKDGKALLWSKTCLDVIPYNYKREKCSWHESSIRTWIKQEFIPVAFNEAEKNAMCAVPSELTSGNGNINDKDVSGDSVFVLSKADFEYYNLSQDQLMAQATPYAVKKDIFSNEDKFAYYWVRTLGLGADAQMFVDVDGSIAERGARINLPSIGVRPAVWVDCQMLNNVNNK